jgi:hypothetical protein
VIGAQKLSLAASIGSLSLMLRRAGEANNQYTRRITLSDLGSPSNRRCPQRPTGVTTASVRRASTREEHSVPVEGANLHVLRASALVLIAAAMMLGGLACGGEALAQRTI